MAGSVGVRCLSNEHPIVRCGRGVWLDAAGDGMVNIPKARSGIFQSPDSWEAVKSQSIPSRTNRTCLPKYTDKPSGDVYAPSESEISRHLNQPPWWIRKQRLRTQSIFAFAFPNYCAVSWPLFRQQRQYRNVESTGPRMWCLCC